MDEKNCRVDSTTMYASSRTITYTLSGHDKNGCAGQSANLTIVMKTSSSLISASVNARKRNLNFTVSGFTLPVQMTWTTDQGVASQLPGILRSGADVRRFVQRFLAQAVFDVLEQQGRSAGLGDAVTAAILSQPTVNISYQPLQCEIVSVNPDARAPPLLRMAMMMGESCVISGNTVIGICRPPMGRDVCELQPNFMNIVRVPEQHLRVTGIITTTNIIMANWSTQMWQSVVNRVARVLALGPFRTNFSGVFATVSGR
ncbi:hypothetical protein KIN20_023460 [Parelaphostrongylus tenuis]|uniref:Uncharacterized protein n=1 Tax=Parelaphostrongylus tenuis TaxID=148309 RepID=A0AAD5N6K1_PARTN|nr:hypothetical protein KIN20_023460 [Parelaphostrongylus tenuis]